MEQRSPRRRQKPRRRGVLLVAIVVVVGLVAAVVYQQRGQSPAALIARAESQLAAGKLGAAVIDLKSASAADPGNARARRLLGESYLKTGDISGALKELRRARELGDSSPEVAQGIVRALILTSNFDAAATELATHGDANQPAWLSLRGMLELAQQRFAQARETFTAVLAKAPEEREARRGLMQTELSDGHPERAREELARLLETEPSDPVLWTIKGGLDLFDQQNDAALEAYRKALALVPGDMNATVGVARAELARGDTEAASAALDRLGDAGKADPRVSFVRALVAEGRGKKEAALLHLREVLQVVPAHRESLVMAARLHFSLGEFARAEDFIGRLLAIEPNNEAANRMLGAIQLASGRLDGLAQFGGSGEDVKDPGVLSLLGTAYLRSGRFEDGRKNLQRAADLAPDSLPIRTQLALSKLSTGKGDEAITDLEAIIKEDPAYVQADIMLAMALLAQKRVDDARAAAAALIDKHPDDALSHNVLGYVLESTDDAAGARVAYETALTKDADFHPARINLARLAIAAGQRDEARTYYEAVIGREPNQPHALLGLAALALEDEKIDEAERLWSLARQHNPDAVAPRLLLARHHRAQANMVQAETLIREAYRLAPSSPPVMAEFVTVMLDNAKYDEALKVAQALVERAPDSAGALELLARAYNQLGDEAGLTTTLERITRLAPEAVGAQVLLARLALRRKDHAGAGRIVEALKKDDKTRTSGLELEGEVHEAQGRSEQALASYRQAFEREPDSARLLKLERVERQLGQAGTRLEDWLKTHPEDVQVRLVQATYLQQAGSSRAAISEYERMLEAQADNAVALNNLAWLYFEAGDERATATARLAFEAASEMPEVVDTYGWILLSSGQREQGLEMLEKAARLAPANRDISYHLASALHDAGRTARARELLDAALAADTGPFALRAEAEGLRAKLSAAD